MEIWRIVKIKEKDAWEKKRDDIPTLPLCNTSLFEWIRDRRVRELTNDEHHPEYWIVFSDAEKSWMERIMAPLAPLRADQILRQWLPKGLSMQVTNVSTKTPVARPGGKMLLAIHVEHRPPPA